MHSDALSRAARLWRPLGVLSPSLVGRCGAGGTGVASRQCGPQSTLESASALGPSLGAPIGGEVEAGGRVKLLAPLTRNGESDFIKLCRQGSSLAAGAADDSAPGPNDNYAGNRQRLIAAIRRRPRSRAQRLLDAPAVAFALTRYKPSPHTGPLPLGPSD